MRIFEYGLIPESGYQGSYERKLKHYKLKHGTVADLLHDSMRLYDPDFDKRIPTLEEMNELLESGYFTRTAEWEPFSIDMEEYEEVVLVETADTYIDALASMKKHLEEFGQKIVRSSEKCDLPKGVTVRKQDSHFTQMINSYKGSSDMAIMFYEVNDEYGCFSNFSKHSFELEGEKWATSEIYFQAKKFEGTEYEEIIRSMTNSLEAAKYGRNRKLPLRSDWEDVKDEIMRKAVIAKFSQNEDIKEILLQTGNEKIIEATTDDYYWGCGTDGTGKNMLGKILMEVRQLLRGAVHRAKVKKTNEIIYICEECDLTYDSENTSDIIITVFDTYAEKKGIEPLWSELELFD